MAPAQRVTVSHVGSGKYSDVFRVRDARQRSGRGVMMKVSYYRKDTLCDFLRRAREGDVDGARRSKRRDSIMVSSAFARVTGRLLEKVSPHFVIVYCDADCRNFAPKLKLLLAERLASLEPLQREFNNLCFMEPFDSNLTQYLLRGRHDEATVRGLVFQVLYTLAAMQALLPGFRHNDLSSNNVLVKSLRRRMQAAYTPPGGPTFYVSVPVLVALSDYDFLHVPDHPVLTNERVVNGRYRVDGEVNRSYDTHFFLKSVLKCLAARKARYAETARFLQGLGLRGEDRQNTEIPGLDPLTLLKHPYFDPLKAPPSAPGSRRALPTYAF